MDVSIYRLRHRDILALCVIALLLLGVMMVQSAAMRVTGTVAWQWTDVGLRQIMFAGVALATFFIVGRIDYTPLARRARTWILSPVFWLVSIAAFTCLIVLVPHIGLEVNGARRWLPLGFTQVQPSELAKWASVLYLSWWLTHRPLDLDSFWRGFLPTLIPIGMLCVLIVVQDFGTTALIGMCSLTMLVVGRIKLKHIAIVLPIALIAAYWCVAHEQYRWRRMTAFRDPWAAPQKEGYHMIQSLLSFATGGVTGRGLGNGIQKLGYLPEDTTDFIFAVICEELGLFGALLTVALYMGILYVAWQEVQKHRDSFGRMLAFGIGSMVGLQATINIAVATVSVPTKGLSLPLVSAGGSGLIITCAALGLLYSVCRFEHAEEVTAPERIEPKNEAANFDVSTSPTSSSAIWNLGA